MADKVLAALMTTSTTSLTAREAGTILTSHSGLADAAASFTS